MIKVFNTPTCPYCDTLKEYLKENNFEFEDIDVSKDNTALDEMIEKSKQMSVPVVEIDEKIIIGFDKKKIDQLLNIRR